MSIVSVKENQKIASFVKNTLLGYRKHQVILSKCTTLRPCSFWDGGSRSHYTLHAIDGRYLRDVPTQSAPEQFGGKPVIYGIPENCVVVETGTFCGKKATMKIHTPNPEHFTS